MDQQIAGQILAELKQISAGFSRQAQAELNDLSNSKPTEVRLCRESIDDLAEALMSRLKAQAHSDSNASESNVSEKNFAENNSKSEKPAPNSSLKVDDFSRRKAMASGFAAAVAGMMLTKPHAASAAVGEENVFLSAILKENLALVAQATQVYTTIHDWVQQWNKFIKDFNSIMDTAEKTRDFVRDFASMEKNPILVEAKQIRDYLNTFLSKNDDIFKFRIKKFSWESQAIVRFLENFISGMDELWDEGQQIAKKLHANPSEKHVADTPPGRMAVRVSQSVSVAAQNEIMATEIRQNSRSMLKQFQETTSDKGQSAGQMFNESSGPMTIELLTSMVELQSQTVYALNTLILSQAGKLPRSGEFESRLSRDDLAEVADSLRAGKKKRDKKKGT